MIHYSPPPVEVGCFDPDEAQLLAQSIREGQFPFKQTEFSGRFVLTDERDVSDALERIGLYTHTADDPTMLRNRVYAQDFSEINIEAFLGLPWHIDSEGRSLCESEMFDFNFGFGFHPTQAFVGRLDLTEPHKFLAASELFGEDFPRHAPSIIKLAAHLIQECIDEASVSGDGQVIELVEGVQYLMPAGVVHKMQHFDQSATYPVRFCIEQYLKPSR